MKYIVAVIQRSKFVEVQTGLLNHGISAITSSEIYERGRTPVRKETFRGAEIVINTEPMTKLEIACHDEKVQAVIDTISGITKTGRLGDGSIYISDIEDTVRISNGERGEGAL